MPREITFYYLPGKPRKNAQTGNTTVQERGPYAASIQGCFWRAVDRDAVTAYVKQRHGVAPSRVERELVPNRRLR